MRQLLETRAWTCPEFRTVHTIDAIHPRIILVEWASEESLSRRLSTDASSALTPHVVIIFSNRIIILILASLAPSRIAQVDRLALGFLMSRGS